MLFTSSRGSHAPFHLLYAADVMILFCGAKRNLQIVSLILETYAIFGQAVNRDKSSSSLFGSCFYPSRAIDLYLVSLVVMLLSIIQGPVI